VQAHAHSNRPFRERVATVSSRSKSIARLRKRNEERITLRVDLDTAMTCERIAQDTPMLCQHLLLVAELVQQPRRSLNMSEQERDSAAREASHPPA
jgi:hypothetical protein